MHKQIIEKGYGKNLLFFVSFLLVFFVLGIQNYLTIRPQSIHIWRQSDCLAITQNYYQDNVPFLEPELLNQMSDGGISGKSVGEFPILYFVVAQLWKVFGKHEWIYRVFGLAIFVLSTFYLFRLSFREFGNVAFSVFVSLLLFTSPTIVYYSFSFLTNVPALSLVLIGWWLVYKYNFSGKNLFFWGALLCFSLGMLLKVTAGISLVALLGWWLIETLFVRHGSKIFKNGFYDVIPFIVCIIPIVGWYWYADYFNDIHQGKYTYNAIWPIWRVSQEKFQKIITAVRLIWLKEYFHFSLLIITGLIWVFLLTQYKKIKGFYFYLILIIPIGSIMYLALWFQSLRFHDYYLINVFINIVLVWFVLFHTFSKNRWINNKIFTICLVFYMGFLVINCNVRLSNRFEGSKNNPYKYRLEAVGELEPILDSMGIGKNVKVISIPDRSINSSLYLMNRKGYTEYGSRFETKEHFYKRIYQGAKYLIISDTTIVDREVLQPFIGNKIMEYRNVFIYDLKDIVIPAVEEN